MMRRYLPLILTLALATPVMADEPTRKGPPEGGGGWDDDGWSLYVGGGGFYSPNWSGDDEYSAAAVPFLRVTKGDVFFASVQEGAGFNVINKDGFKVGPLATLDFGRDEDGNNPFRLSGDDSVDLIGLGNVDFTVALGGFAEYKTGDIKFKAKAGRAVSSHEGVTAELGVDYDKQFFWNGPPLFVAVGPRIKWADDHYNQAYYGITAAQSAGSGLADFDAGSGIVGYGLGGSVIMPLTRSGLAITFFGNYERLTGAAADSPLIIERGSKDQFFGGSALAYRF